MKVFLLLITNLFLFSAVYAQAQDTTARKQPSGQVSPAATKTVTPAKNNNPAEPSPVINKIAVSDPGMPPEKNSTTRDSNVKQARKKKKSRTEATPK